MPRARWVVGAIGFVLLTVSGVADAAPPRGQAGVLPLRRVRLYETGVGYFERRGRIGAHTGLPVPSTHLDDALKTLVVLGGGKDGRIESVRFDTLVTEQLGRALARLPTESGAALDFEALARSLTGMEVALGASSTQTRGRLLQVLAPEESGFERCLPGVEVAAEPKQKEATNPAPCVLRREAGIVLLSERDELMRFALSQVHSLRPLHPADADRLWSAFKSTSGSTRSEQQLQLLGGMSDDVTLGYVTEAPLWRATYRIVLAAEQATLQAWALLHNDSEESWSRVQVELVSGQPDSFLFPFAAPRYAARRLVTPEQQLGSVPQLLGRGADELWDRGDVDETLGMGGLGLAGVGHGMVGTGRGGGGSDGPDESDLLAVGDLTHHAQAIGEETGALFRYTLGDPLDLAAHASVLVPLLQQSMPVSRVSVFALDATVAQSALLFRNQTKQTLPSGTVAIFEDGGFGGESAIDRLKPGQQRLLPFGLDLDVELTRKDRAAHTYDRRRLVRFENGALVEHIEHVEDTPYVLHNRAASARRVHIALDVVNNAKIERADEVLVLDNGEVSAVFDVPAQTVREVALHVVQGLERRFELEGLSAKRLSSIAADTNLPAAQRALLARAAELIAVRERVGREQRQLDSEIELLTQRADRARESLPIVAKADPERGRALAHELVATENRLSAAERKRAALDPKAGLRAAMSWLAQLK